MLAYQSINHSIPYYKNLTTSGGSAKTLMKNFACKKQICQSVQSNAKSENYKIIACLVFTCLVLAPDIRRSVVTIPGCNTKKEAGTKRKTSHNC